MIDIEELHTIPRYLGDPFYPLGVPISPDQHHVNGDSIKEIYFNKCEGKASDEELQSLKEYIIYYVNAPAFYSDYTLELIQKDLADLSLDELIDECMKYGLDPF